MMINLVLNFRYTFGKSAGLRRNDHLEENCTKNSSASVKNCIKQDICYIELNGLIMKTLVNGFPKACSLFQSFTRAHR